VDLTESFAASDWTDQEIGIAVALRKIIVPMKLTLDPYGVIGRYQAQSFAGVADDVTVGKGIGGIWIRNRRGHGRDRAWRGCRKAGW